MVPVRRGALLEASGGIGIEQILGPSNTPAQDYLRDNDEFVVVFAGDATLEIGGESIELRERDAAVAGIEVMPA